MTKGMNNFTIFTYRKCCNCKREFRREWSWLFCTYRTTTSIAYGIADESYIICKNCANTEEEAKKIAIDLYANNR